jgi:hypothetical protein
MINTREYIILYQYSERLKSELLIGFKLLTSMSSLDGEALRGAERITAAYFEALLADVRTAQNTTKTTQFMKAETKIMEALGLLKLYEFADINRCIAEAVSAITTSCQLSMEALEKADLL